MVGAVVGLFNRLYNESSNDNSVEDYGLTSERLRLTPILSGLGALGGVLVVAMLPAALTGVLALASPFGSSGPAASPSIATPILDQVYSLRGNPFGVVFAGIFGLTPQLLLGALQDAGERYRRSLRSTTAAPTHA